MKKREMPSWVVGGGGGGRLGTCMYVPSLNFKYCIYSINRPGRLLNFWTLRVGAYSRLGSY